ncbi:MAG: hypothetical protein AAF846_00970 [Chloroflexota bacterium]
MTVQYYAKVTNMQAVEVAVAHSESQAQMLREQKYEPCSRTFYESTVRNSKTSKTSK